MHIEEREVAAAHRLAAEAGEGGPGLLVGAHLDEAVAFRAAGVAVQDDLGRPDGAERLEHPPQLAVPGVVGQVADVQLLAHQGPHGRPPRTTSNPGATSSPPGTTRRASR